MFVQLWKNIQFILKRRLSSSVFRYGVEDGADSEPGDDLLKRIREIFVPPESSESATMPTV